MKAGLFLLLLAAGLGLLLGLGGFTFQRAEGLSYLSDDPASCMNCHVMRDQYETWNHSSHRNWATCNDCHTPKNFVGKWATKAINGWNHSVKFTTMNFEEPIRINEMNKRIAVNRCLDCHGAITAQMNLHSTDPDEVRCLDCHGNPGHQTQR